LIGGAIETARTERLVAGLLFEGPGKAGQAIIGNWLPHGGAGDVQATDRPYPGVAVEGSHADVDDLRFVRVL
jgi:hypothetical protein